MKNNINTMLIPQIGRPYNKASESLAKKSGEQDISLKQELRSEFINLLESNNDLKQVYSESSENLDDQVEFSAHALKRLKQRNLEMDNDEYLKIKTAIEKLRNKCGQDSLVVTNKAAYIVDVAKGKIVTAMDKEDMAENVFTKIDSTLIVN